MVSGVHFYATTGDQHLLLDHLGEPGEVTLWPWPVVTKREGRDAPLSRAEALQRTHVMVRSRSMGGPIVLTPNDLAGTGASRSEVFARLNWERLGTTSDEGVVDSNTSPVLLWTPATELAGVLRSGQIGSQADSMRAVSVDYERWVRRTTAWVRRNGEKVWGVGARDRRNDLDLRRPDVTTVVALPGALAAMEAGHAGR